MIQNGKTSHLFFFILLVATLVACGNAQQGEVKKPGDIRALSGSLCSCMKPITLLNDQIQKANQSGATQIADSLFRRVNQLMVEATECIDEVELSYGSLSQTEEKQLEAALLEDCPEIAKILREAQRFRKEF